MPSLSPSPSPSCLSSLSSLQSFSLSLMFFSLLKLFLSRGVSLWVSFSLQVSLSFSKSLSGAGTRIDFHSVSGASSLYFGLILCDTQQKS